MTLVIPEGFGLATWRFSLVDDPEVMIVTCGVDTQFGVSGPQELVGKLADDFMTAFINTSIQSGYTFLGCTLYAGSAGGGTVIYEAPRTHVGTNNDNPMTQNVAFLVRKATMSPGRQGRGRMYLPPILVGEGSVAPNGMIQANLMGVLQTRIENAFVGGGFVILHDSASPGDHTPTPIFQFVLDRQIATQRRRLR
jgi:hypothetical protein